MSEYTTPLAQYLKEIGTNTKTGLSSEQVKQQLEKFGENTLKGKKHLNFFQKFMIQMKDYMVIILLIAAAISFVIALVEGHGEFVDSIIILAIVVLNGILGVTQESKAEKALDALQDISAPTAKVLRDGTVTSIPSSLVVPGDIFFLEAGDFVPADARLVESASLKSEESALTGESVPVEKNSNAQVVENAPIGDRLNMVYSGCSISYGRGVAVVTGTGMTTEMGKIAGLLNDESSELTPLQQKLNALGKTLGILAIAVCAIIFVVGLLRGIGVMDMFMTAVSLAVAAIPEGLTAVVTVILAVGVQKMVQKNAIIRHLPAVETLGSASVICSDKTGTLTQNRMTVQEVWVGGGEIAQLTDQMGKQEEQLLLLGTLCNDGRIEMDGDTQRHVGDPTETAIVAAALKTGLNKTTLEAEYKRVGEIPFDSDRKLMTTINIVGGKPLAIVKGGPDVLLARCTSGEREKAEAINLAMGKQALRVLAVGCRELDSIPENPTSDELENGLTFIGLIGMIDPPREESKQAVTECHSAGIKTVMITGDHVVTASAIAKELGILTNDDQAISGQELAKLTQEQLIDRVEKYTVYARVSPEDKIRIVKAWQARGEVVAMTGDGVNDAPALKAADIGCAMGITGTDVAKGAADMVLTDDNFATIVESVESGRGIFANIKKTIQFLLGSNLGEIFVVFFAILFGWDRPLLAIHLLLVNIVTDALPALALGMEPVDSDIMKQKPVPKNQGVFAGGMGLIIGLQGAMIGILTLSAYYVGCFVEMSPAFLPSHEIGMTMAFLVLSLSQLVQAFNCRSTQSLFKIGFFTNKTMLQAFVVSFAVIMLICFIPPLADIFHISALAMGHILLVSGLSFAPLVIMEIAKAVVHSSKKQAV